MGVFSRRFRKKLMHEVDDAYLALLEGITREADNILNKSKLEDDDFEMLDSLVDQVDQVPKDRLKKQIRSTYETILEKITERTRKGLEVEALEYITEIVESIYEKLESLS
jgi:uncharacterized protein YoxC